MNALNLYHQSKCSCLSCRSNSPVLFYIDLSRHLELAGDLYALSQQYKQTLVQLMLLVWKTMQIFNYCKRLMQFILTNSIPEG